jgi:hypothetical protein
MAELTSVQAHVFESPPDPLVAWAGWKVLTIEPHAMQHEIEALLAAYLDERKKEARIVQELLTALSVGASGRQKMFDAIVAIGQAQPATAVEAPVKTTPSAAAIANFAQLSVADDLTASIGKLRKARDAAFAH